MNEDDVVMSEKSWFEPKTPTQIHSLIESGAEFNVELEWSDESMIAVSNGIGYSGSKTFVKEKIDASGNLYNTASMIVEDRNGLKYILNHRLIFDRQNNAYKSVCRAYDIINTDELSHLEGMAKAGMIEFPKAQPVILRARGREVKEYGNLWVIETSYIKSMHRARMLPIPSSLEFPYENIDVDAYLEVFKTYPHAYGRGLGSSVMSRVEGIASVLNPEAKQIKFVGELQPLDRFMRYKRKSGEASVVMRDEYGTQHVDDAYCALVKIYQKLGFEVSHFSALLMVSNGRYLNGLKKATIISKNIDPREEWEKIPILMTRHFANPLKFSGDDDQQFEGI